jgi:hypothetical protein
MLAVCYREGGLGSHIQYMKVSLTSGMEETEESITSNKWTTTLIGDLGTEISDK